MAVFVVDALMQGALSASWSLQTSTVTVATLWQLLASIFVHWDPFHLIGNLYFLFAFGRLPEARLGPALLACLFLASGLAGNLLFLALNLGADNHLAGASGGISGILGFYFAAFPGHRVGLSLFFTVLRVPAFVYLGIWFVLQIALAGGEQDLVAYSVHVSGFVAGVAGALIWRLRPHSAT